MARYAVLTGSFSLLGLVSIVPAAMAQATPAPAPTQSVVATAETKDFSDDRGSLSSLTVEYKLDRGDTTILLAPTVGERSTAGAIDSSAGIGATVYRDWSETISTRSSVFVAEDTPVFARFDVAQDFTVRVGRLTTVTTGVRWAEYFGNREATFYSLGARQYFKGGSVAYRLTRTQVEGQDGFFAHLASLSLNDPQGEGKTQFWLSSGETSLSQSQFDDGFSRSNRAFVLQRTQPLWRDVALVASAGLSFYDTLGGRYTATSLGIGLSVGH